MAKPPVRVQNIRGKTQETQFVKWATLFIMLPNSSIKYRVNFHQIHVLCCVVLKQRIAQHGTSLASYPHWSVRHTDTVYLHMNSKLLRYLHFSLPPLFKLVVTTSKWSVTEILLNWGRFTTTLFRRAGGAKPWQIWRVPALCIAPRAFVEPLIGYISCPSQWNVTMLLPRVG